MTGGRATGLRILPSGDSALLVEVRDLAAVFALHAALTATRPAGVVDIVPAARTVLVTVDPASGLAAVRAWIERVAVADAAAPPPASAPVVIGVRYDGPDLAALSAQLGLTPGALAAAHMAADWRVAFSGFAPGFGYLVSADWPYRVPRLATPRTRVPAGAIALAGEFTGVYPRESPGGWQLIGATDASLWNPAAEPPALLAPGVRVRFEERP